MSENNMVNDLDVQPGAIFQGRKGSDRKVVRRVGGEVSYVRRLPNKEWGTELRECWITTFCAWALHQLEK